MPDVLELLARVDEGVYAVDGEQRIVLWNQRAQDILGYDRGEVVGRSCEEIIAGTDDYCLGVCQRDCLVIRAARVRGRAPSHEIQTRTKDGREVWLHISHVVVPAARDSLVTVAHIFRDVTAERQSRAALKRVIGALSGLGAELPRTSTPTAMPVTFPGPLSRREAEVLRQLCEGAHPQQIADRLFISVATARNHVKSILRKLGVHTSLEAVAWATRHKLS